VQGLIAEHESSFANRGNLLWGLLSIELWHQLYIDAGARIESQYERTA